MGALELYNLSSKNKTRMNIELRDYIKETIFKASLNPFAH